MKKKIFFVILVINYCNSIIVKGQVQVIEEFIEAKTFDNQFLDTLLRPFAIDNVLWNAPYVDVKAIDNRSHTFVQFMERKFGKETYKKILKLKGGDSFWKNLKKDTFNIIKEPWVDNFFYDRDSLLKLGKIKSGVIMCFYNPICFKVIHPNKQEKYFAIVLSAIFNSYDKCNLFGREFYTFLFEKKQGYWHLVESSI